MEATRTTEFPPLWPEGFHPVTLDEIRARCVEAFHISTRRKPLMDAFAVILDYLAHAGVTCQIWLDGSFVTAKINPNDIDFIAVVDSRIYDEGTDEVRHALDALTDGDLWEPSMACDTNVAYIDPPEYASALNVLSYWQRRFGFSIVDQTPKGIPTIKLLPANVPGRKRNSEDRA